MTTTMRPILAIIYGVLVILVGIAIALSPPLPWLSALYAAVALGAAWYAAYLLVWRDVERLGQVAQPLGKDDESVETVVPAALAERRDSLGDIARALKAQASALATCEARLRDAEANLRHNEARYRDLFDANPHPMIVFDTETLEILAANDRAVTQYGFSRHQFLRMTVRHLLPEAVTGGAAAVLQRMAVDRDRPVETFHRKRDGTVVAVEVASHRIRFAGRSAALAMCVDITQRKAIEAENRRRTEALEALYATARALAESLSLTDVAQMVADAAVHRFGGTAAWVARRREDGQLEPLAAASAAPGLWADGQRARVVPLDPASAGAMEKGVAAEYDPSDPGWSEAWWRRADGDEAGPEDRGDFPGRWAMALPLISRDRAFGVVHVCMAAPPDAGRASLDAHFAWSSKEETEAFLTSFALQAASALVNADLHEELQRTADILEQRVEQRTAELQEANKELEAFSYSVSHDLRAPLRTVDGFARLALMQFGDSIPAGCRTLLESVRCGAAEMKALIEGLLEFSRSARQSLHVREMDPTDLAHSVLDSLRHEMAGRAIHIEVLPMPRCKADPVLLRQVYANLLSNAIKFTAKREHARIEVGAQVSDAGTTYYVSDNGAGFDVTRAQRLFGVFQRFHRAEDFPGTGVGLATVHRIVTRHGGRIWCQSAPDEGTTFYFTLEAL